MIEKEWKHEGYLCVVKMYEEGGHRCGYVGIPKEHPLYKKDYDDVDDFNVHGGLTYSNSDLLEVPSKDTWWFGYDCGHYGDKPDLSVMPKRYRKIREKYADPDGIIRSLAYCITECENLAKQLKEK